MEKTENVGKNLAKIRTALKSGYKLTVTMVLRCFGTSELRHYLSQLRKEGLDIKDEWQSEDGKRWKVYWLNNDK